MGLGRFVAKRIFHGAIVVWGVVTVVFFLRFLTPGDPTSALVPPDAGQEVRERLREQLGLDQPLYIQYFDYLNDLAVADLGQSMVTNRSVNQLILNRLPATLELALAGTIIAIGIAIPLGVISARRRHQSADYGATLFSLVGISTPNFWLGIMLILLVAVRVDFIPVGGRQVALGTALTQLATDQSLDGLIRWFGQIILPALTLGTYFTALLTRLTRSGMLEELGKSYVKACRAKGLPETLTLYKHVLRNTLIPIITVLGLQLGTLIGGAVITEEVYGWPGLGRFFITSINNRDWTAIQGTILVIGVGFVIINIVVDALAAHLNPKTMEE